MKVKMKHDVIKYRIQHIIGIILNHSLGKQFNKNIIRIKLIIKIYNKEDTYKLVL